MTASTATKKQADQAEKLASVQREMLDASQSQFLAAVKASQKMALDAASAWAGTVSQSYPSQFAPFASEWRASASANLDLAAELLEAHREFTTSLLDVLVPVEK